MRFAGFCAAGAAAWFVAALPAARAAEPAEHLARAAQAGRTATYQGVLVYRGGDEDFEVLRVQHRFANGSEREHIASLTGEVRQLLRIDNHLICILPKDHTLSMDGPPALKGVLSELNAERLHDLAQWYEFRDLGQTRVAGRACNGVGVVPRDQFRYGYAVCADAETGVPLKVTLVGQHGEMLEQVMFTEITYPDSIPDSAFLADIDTSKFQTVTGDLPAKGAAVDPAQSQLQFAELPPGYRIVAREERPLPAGQQGKVEHLLLSDGLSAVSVFSTIEQSLPEKPFRGVSHQGALEAYGRTMGSYHITIVGEVPPQAVRMIGDGVHPVFPAEGAPPHASPDPAPAPQ
ncbi:MAG: MucB/RseB C-terminal domain-containing protein [Nevskia sp.]|nr:MucB/RseB C-terminal domain-containing protein [Nevskia sp.]